MMNEYNKGMEKILNRSVNGASIGAVLGLCALKNKRKNMFRMGAIGSGIGAGYSFY
jgi:hypothetical protein